MQLRQLVTDLRDLDAVVSGKTRTAQILSSSHKQLDARNLLNVANDLDREATQLELLLRELAGRAELAQRSTPKAPPVQIGFGKVSPSFGGELAEIGALCRRLPKGLIDLHRKAHHLRVVGMTDINSPTRIPDPASYGPVVDLFNTVLSVVEAIVEFRGHWGKKN